jgi:NAD(P)H-dependent FMN reductase
METPVKVLVLSGSARAASLNTQLARAAAKVAETRGAAVHIASLRDFPTPMFDGDVEAATGIPVGAHDLKARLEASDCLMIASPEYNASMPGALKNLIDWTSRFRPQPFDSRHCLLMSASPSMVGGNRGLWSLRVPLEHLGSRVYPDMFSLSQAHKALVDGEITDAGLAARFDKTVNAFLDLAEAAKHYPCMKRAWIEFLGEPPGGPADRVDVAPI